LRSHFCAAGFTGIPQAEIAPITGPMYQLFVFFMITDPRPLEVEAGPCVVAFAWPWRNDFCGLISVYAPLYALFMSVRSMSSESWWNQGKLRQQCTIKR